MTTRRAAVLALAALLTGCAVIPLPKATALRQQSADDQKWDARECAEEVGAATGYNPGNSPGANLLTHLFFWGTTGAAVGGTITGFPATVAGEASEGLIAGAAAGGAVGGIRSWSGQQRFERAWTECMRARGYDIAPGEQKDQAHPAPSPR